MRYGNKPEAKQPLEPRMEDNRKDQVADAAASQYCVNQQAAGQVLGGGLSGMQSKAYGNGGQGYAVPAPGVRESLAMRFDQATRNAAGLAWLIRAMDHDPPSLEIERSLMGIIRL